MLKLNEKLKEQFKENCIDYNEGMTTLLILYFGLEHNNSAMNDKIITLLSVAQIIDYDYEKEEYIFNIPVFEKETNVVNKKVDISQFDDEFLNEYVKKFRNVNKARIAYKPEILKRIKKLLEECDKNVTKEELLKAVDMHVARLRSPDFLKQADYFIWGRDCGFYCMTYIQELRENPDDISYHKNNMEDCI